MDLRPITTDAVVSTICDMDNEYHDDIERYIRCRQLDSETVHIIFPGDEIYDIAEQTFEVKVREI